MAAREMENLPIRKWKVEVLCFGSAGAGGRKETGQEDRDGGARR